MASRKRTSSPIERQRQLIYNLQHEWKIADLLGAKAARLKAAKKLIAAERKLDRMLGLSPIGRSQRELSSAYARHLDSGR
jgi:hypothetical protein